MRNIGKTLAVVCFAALAFSANASEHFAFRDGKVFRHHDGNEVAVTAEVRLNNGARLLPDGFIVFTDGRRERFRDDRWLAPTGEYIVIANADTDFDGYWFEDGHVYVIRDRRPVIVTTEIVLRDGGRLQPDGVLILKDGRRDRLSVGIGITLDGKRTEHRGHGRATDNRDTRAAVDTREKPIDTSKKIETTPPAATREAEAKAKAAENTAKAAEQRQENAAKATEQRQENAANRQEKREENQVNRQEKREENQTKREEKAENRQEKREENAAKREEKK